ncbi:hypothetical protein BB561_007027, partial [Smittium simulii]
MKFYILFLWGFILATALSSVRSNTFSDNDDANTPLVTNVINGKPASKKNFSFIAQIYLKYPNKKLKHQCGGTLIAQEYIITAAHCLYDNDLKKIPLKYIKVVVGQMTRKTDKNSHKLYSVKNMHTFDYNENTDRDFAVIELSSIVPKTTAISAGIYSGKIFNNLPVVVAGFGITDPVSLKEKSKNENDG